MSGGYYVYVLYRLNGEPFYVGKGTGDRWLRHERRTAHLQNLHKSRVIEQILKDAPSIPKRKVAEDLSEAAALAMEVALIAQIGRQPQGPLVNLTDGGEGVSGFSHSEESRARMSRQRKGAVFTNAHRESLSAALKGTPRPYLKERNQSEAHRTVVVSVNKRRQSARVMMDALSPEAMSARNAKVQASIEPARRREIALRRAEEKTPEEHSERVRRANMSQTPEQRRARQLKAWITRRERAAACALENCPTPMT